jgi:hypothetical protein
VFESHWGCKMGLTRLDDSPGLSPLSGPPGLARHRSADVRPNHVPEGVRCSGDPSRPGREPARRGRLPNASAVSEVALRLSDVVESDGHASVFDPVSLYPGPA